MSRHRILVGFGFVTLLLAASCSDNAIPTVPAEPMGHTSLGLEVRTQMEADSLVYWVNDVAEFVDSQGNVYKAVRRGDVEGRVKEVDLFFNSAKVGVAEIQYVGSMTTVDKYRIWTSDRLGWIDADEEGEYLGSDFDEEPGCDQNEPDGYPCPDGLQVTSSDCDEERTAVRRHTRNTIIYGIVAFIGKLVDSDSLRNTALIKAVDEGMKLMDAREELAECESEIEDPENLEGSVGGVYIIDF